MNATEKVSIIVPTHNRPDKLPTALNSILNQTYTNIEIVVVDDNEPDSDARMKTEKVIDGYSEDNRIIYLKNDKCLGGGPARNVGIKAATGTYITFLDDDDRYLDKKIEKQVQFIQSENIEMCFGDIYIHNDADRLIEFRHNIWADGLKGQDLLKGLVIHGSAPTPSIMIKKEVVDRIGGFDDVPVGQEYVFTWKMIENGVDVKYFNSCDVVAYAHSQGRISNGENKIKGEAIMFELKKTKLNLLNKKEKRYLYFRHYAVLALTSFRNRNFTGILKYGLIIILKYPFLSLKEIIKVYNNKKTAKDFNKKY